MKIARVWFSCLITIVAECDDRTPLPVVAASMQPMLAMQFIAQWYEICLRPVELVGQPAKSAISLAQLASFSTIYAHYRELASSPNSNPPA